MADEKITDLPVATVVNPSDVLPMVQGGITKQAAASLLPGSFLSTNTARVDPSGNDGTGEVGDLSKPFLTLQAAFGALEAQGGFESGSPAVVLLPISDLSDNVSTSLTNLLLQGVGEYNVSAPATGIITLTSSDGVELGLENVFINGVLAPNLGTNELAIHLNSSIINGDITTTGDISVSADYHTGTVTGTITSGNERAVTIIGLVGRIDFGQFPTINAVDGQVQIFSSIINTVTAAGTIDLFDSRILTNNSGVTPTYSDTLLNPALMDFSTLPTTLPTRVGAAWIDTTGGNNIVKVKL